MRRVNIVMPYESFAMQRHVMPLMKMRGVKMTKGDDVDTDADVNIHMPWHPLIEYEPQGKSKHIMAFTHANPRSTPAIYRAARKADAITTLSWEARQMMVDLGIDPRKLHVAPGGTDQIGFRRRRVGVVASIQPNARKRMHLLLDLVWNMPELWLNLIEFVIVGNGWEGVEEQIKNAGGNVLNVGNIESDKEMMNFYHNFDVLLSTAYNEGGPLPVIEAMSGGIPVLTPDYGYAKDYLPDEYKYDSAEDLLDKLIKMFTPSLENAQIASTLSWYNYAQEYALIINKLTGAEVRLNEDDGTPRYSGLMQVVESVKPRNIMEIGTWNGKRAQQMIQRAAGYRPIETIYYAGFDLFDAMDENMLRKEFSKIPPPEHVVRRLLDATDVEYNLFAGKSAVTLPGADMGETFDLVYIDGGHRTDTIRLDWENVQRYLHDNSMIVFDDYYHDRPDEMEGYGCNEVVDGLGDEWLTYHLQPTTKHKKEFGELEIGMVAVKHA